MKILVTFALKSEFAPWRRLRPLYQVASEPVVFETRMAGAEVRAVLTGIGACSANCVAELLRHEQPDFCIATGLAGGLKVTHRPGDILAACMVRGADGGRAIESDRKLLRLAMGCGAKAVGCFYTSERLVRTAAEKSAAGAGADAVDMESYLILAELSRWSIPALAVRAVADPVEQDLPLDFTRAIANDGQLRLGRVVLELVGAPHRLPAFLRLSAQASRAAKNLARFLDSYLFALAREKQPGEALTEVAAG